MDGQLVEFKSLPSQGVIYPKDVEIYVKPLTLREQIDMERYGISQAEYFNTLLNGVTVKGSMDKSRLLHADVQFLDVVRRLVSYDTKDTIIMKDETCRFCGHKFDYEFKMSQIEFSDFNPDIFGKHFKFGEGTEDELEIVVSPLTISEFISMSKEIRNYSDKKNALSSIFLEYCCCCTREIVGREFKDRQDRDSFLKGYLADLCTGKDKDTIKKLEDETVIDIKPFKLLCEECGRETEVVVSPTSTFQQ